MRTLPWFTCSLWRFSPSASARSWCAPASGSRPGTAADPILVRELEDRVHRDRDVAAQRGDAESGARVPARLAQRLHHQVGAAVEDLRLLEEAGRRAYVAADPHAALHARPVAADCGFYLRQDVETAQAGRRLSVLDRDLISDASGKRILAVAHRRLPGDEEQTLRDHGGHVVRRWRRRIRQRQAEPAQPGIHVEAHGSDVL